MVLCCVGFNWRIVVGLGKIFIKFVLGFFWFVDLLSGLFFVMLLFGGKICERGGCFDVNDFKEVSLVFWVWIL